MLGWLCEEKITEAKIGRQRSKIIAFSTLAHIRIEAFFASVFRGGAALPRIRGRSRIDFRVLRLQNIFFWTDSKKNNSPNTQMWSRQPGLNTHTRLLHSEGSVLDSGLEHFFEGEVAFFAIGMSIMMEEVGGQSGHAGRSKS